MVRVVNNPGPDSAWGWWFRNFFKAVKWPQKFILQLSFETHCNDVKMVNQ